MNTFLFALLVATPVAQEEEPQIVHARRTVVELSQTEVMGEVVRPNQAYVMVRSRSCFNVLIRVRDNFRPELLRSVEAL